MPFVLFLDVTQSLVKYFNTEVMFKQFYLTLLFVLETVDIQYWSCALLYCNYNADFRGWRTISEI